MVDQQGQPRKTAKQWFRFAVAQHRAVFIEAIFASFITSLLGLFIALYTMQVYDRVVPTRGYSTLWVLSIGVVLAIGFEYMMKQARSRIVDIASKKIDLELSSVFFGAMTYIGNGPNFMVKAIAEENKIKMPSFFGYMIKFSLIVLLPVYILVQLIFL